MKPLCIYHGNCADGFGAAWAVRHYFGDGNVEFHAGLHGEAPPDTTGRDVVIVDFCYKRSILDEMAAKANGVLVLDHHKTAQDDLLDVAGPKSWEPWLTGPPAKLGAVFDMGRSGAGLTWDFFFPKTARPKLLDHIEDRDLWRFRLDGTREIQAALFAYPYDFSVWDSFMLLEDFDRLRAEGATIERKHFRDIDELLGACQRRLVIGGHDVPVANLPYTLTNDAGHKMAQGEPFAACYYDRADGRVFSLRSTEGGLDVSEIAKAYGGGGHTHAAGFQVPRDHELVKS
ncbi:MAG: DHHA1 domain-containing protein [Proteobacteria bacterium]|nr:DHHA1 domain-containing protein [Pseudomonadota bacterium]